MFHARSRAPFICSQHLRARSPSDPSIGSILKKAKHRFAMPKIGESCQLETRTRFTKGPATDIRRFFMGDPASRTVHKPFQWRVTLLILMPSTLATSKWPHSWIAIASRPVSIPWETGHSQWIIRRVDLIVLSSPESILLWLSTYVQRRLTR